MTKESAIHRIIDTGGLPQVFASYDARDVIQYTNGKPGLIDVYRREPILPEAVLLRRLDTIDHVVDQVLAEPMPYFTSTSHAIGYFIAKTDAPERTYPYLLQYLDYLMPEIDVSEQEELAKVASYTVDTFRMSRGFCINPGITYQEPVESYSLSGLTSELIVHQMLDLDLPVQLAFDWYN